MNEIAKKTQHERQWFFVFYKKRFNRIYPALVYSILFSFLISLFNATPSELKFVNTQTIYSLSFLSNLFYLLNTSSYFSGASDSYLLLHTWSLAIEFQFYIIFPFIYFFAIKKLKSNNLILLLTIASLSLCLLVVHYNQKVAFYLLPFRAWELFLGSYISNLKGCPLSNNIKKPLEIALLAVLILFLMLDTGVSEWPNYYALVPTLITSTYIYLHMNNENTLLRSKPIQYIGSISYSVYLYHWPLVYFIYQSQVGRTIAIQSIFIVLSLILGAMSYHLVEKKYKNVNMVILLASILTVSFSFLASTFDISKYYLPEEKLTLDKYRDYGGSEAADIQFGNSGKSCFLTSKTDNVSYFTVEKCLHTEPSKKNILLFGDSHAAQFSQALHESLPNYNIIQITSSGCVPLLKTSGPERCTKLINNTYTHTLNNMKFDAIIIGANWFGYKKDNSAENFLNTNKTLKSHANNVIFIGQSKAFDSPFYKFSKYEPADLNKHTRVESKQFNALMMKSFGKDIKYINIFDAECLNDKCNPFIGNIPMMFDDNHFTYEWTKLITTHKLIPILKLNQTN